MDPRIRVWRGSQVPTDEKGIKVLGTPLGHADFVSRQLQTVLEEQHILLNRIPRVQDVQSAWLILLHCASARAKCYIRALHPAATSAFAAAHDARLWQCLCSILQLDPVQVDVVRETATVPLSLGGLGLRSAQRTRIPAFWASWADSLAMIRQRHPDVAVQLFHQLEGHPDTPCLQAAADAARSLHGVRGFIPSWEALSHGVRPEPLQPDEFEPGCQRGGWQHEAASRVEVQFRDENLFNRMDNASKAFVRSQGGVGAGLAFSTCPLCRVTRLEPHVFRVLLLRRLRLPLPLSGRSCRCGLPLDSSGHHRAACARAGVLGGGGSLWRMSQQGSAARLAAGSPPMPCSVIWIWLRPTCSTRDVWKWWWTAFLSSVVSSWLWTPPWSVPFTPMAKHGEEQHAQTEWLWQLLEGGRSVPTPS